jgi:phosphatidylserine decarboxylase
LPRNHLSWLTGQVAAIRFPKPIARILVKKFATLAKIDLDSTSQPIDEYRSIAQLFVRDLKPGLRKIEGEIVSPVDGRLRGGGRIKDGIIPQVKDKTYNVNEFLGNNPLAAKFRDGEYLNFYLAPPDYHHVHAPVSGKILRRVYVPGTLWPVNGWGLANIDGLFSKNERIITFIESQFGLVAVVMVGAANVGRMTLSFDDVLTNQCCSSKDSVEAIRDFFGVNIAVGERLGTFHLGSTVVLLFERGSIAVLPELEGSLGIKVRFGQLLGNPKIS